MKIKKHNDKLLTECLNCSLIDFYSYSLFTNKIKSVVPFVARFESHFLIII